MVVTMAGWLVNRGKPEAYDDVNNLVGCPLLLGYCETRMFLCYLRVRYSGCFNVGRVRAATGCLMTPLRILFPSPKQPEDIQRV